MRTISIALVLSVSLATACGGEPPPAPVTPPQPTVAVTPPPPEPTPAPEPAPAPKPSMAELPTKSLKSIADTFGDAKAYAGNYSEDGVTLVLGLPEAKGREAIAKTHQNFLDGFPDMKIGFARTYQKGNVVVAEWVITGTNSKDFMGMKATNKPVGINGATVAWFNDDGMMKESHIYMDMGTLLGQLGASKAKVRAAVALPANVDMHVAKGNGDEDKNVEASKSTYSALESKKEADFLAVVDDAIEYDDMTQPASMKGKAEAKKFFGMWTKAFPDQKNTVTNAWGFDDYVVLEYNTKATHKGPLGPIKATNKPVDLHGVDIFKMANGKMTRGWTYANGGELMTEIGLMPKPGEAPKPAAAAKPAAPAAPKAAAPAAPAAGAKPAPAAPKPVPPTTPKK